jgi:hypothetical protein
MTIVIAHSGHWLVQLVYAVPLVVMGAPFLTGYLRQRREARRDGSTNRPPA